MSRSLRPDPPNDRRVTHPQAWITLWRTAWVCWGQADRAQRQRVAITKPDSTMAKPITRFQYCPELSGIGYLESET